MVKVVFISSLATPMMNKFCDELNKYCEARFIFYEEAVTRPKWWRSFKLSANATILEGTIKLSQGKYYNFSLTRNLARLNPDIVIIGGLFIPSNYFAYRWAIKNNKKVHLYSEKLGYSSNLASRKKLTYKPFFKKLFRYLYRDVDSIFAVGHVGYNCFTKEFGFAEDQVKQTQYPVDMEKHLDHPLRTSKNGLRFLFPHRLIDTYNPQAAVRWFQGIYNVLPESRLTMNGFGLHRHAIEELVEEIGLTDVISFADSINSWDDLHTIYKNSDVILSTKSAIPGDSDWSIAEMEACASGMGFIINNSSYGLVNYLQTHKSGFVIQHLSDLKGVIEAAKEYSGNQQLLPQHCEANKKHIRRFSITKYANEFYQYLVE